MKTARIDAEGRTAILRQCPLFAQVDEALLRELADRAVARRYDSKEVLFRQGERAEGFFVVAEGLLEVFRASPAGREQILHLLGGGEPCGEVPIFQGGAYPASARAGDETIALYIPGDQFLDLATRRPTILLEMLAVLSMRLRKFVHLIDDLSLKEVTARLANYVLDLAERERSDQPTLDCDKGHLASRIGTIAETLSRSFRKLQQAGLLTVKGKRIAILDREGLKAIGRPS